MSRTSLLTAELTTGGWTHEPESWYHDHIPQSTYIITLCYLWPAAYFSHELDVNNYCYCKMHTHPIFLYQNIKVCVFFLSKRQNDLKFQWLCLHCWDHKQGPGHWKKPVWGFQASTFCSQDCICSLWATTPLFYEQHEAQTSERNAFLFWGSRFLVQIAVRRWQQTFTRILTALSAPSRESGRRQCEIYSTESAQRAHSRRCHQPIIRSNRSELVTTAAGFSSSLTERKYLIIILRSVVKRYLMPAKM